jgi:phospholipase C
VAHIDSSPIRRAQPDLGFVLDAPSLSAPSASSYLKRLSTFSVLVSVALGAAQGELAAADSAPTTPIRHLVVIYDENVSFDHYFGTYPHAANGPGETPFHAVPGTPTVNGLSGVLLSHNPNGINPFRLGRADAVTCDMDHAYSAEQKAYSGGLAARFVQATTEYAKAQQNCTAQLVMGYYDGNTVAALWRYAQRFALNDNNFATMFGPSTPGALDLFAAQTSGADQRDLPNETIDGDVIDDAEPLFDDCAKAPTITISNTRTIGDLLNEHGLSWGWFQGGYRPTKSASDNGGKALCGASSKNAAGANNTDYSSHHNPVAYFSQFKNPHHLPPTSIDAIGRSDQAMHQYDLDDFWRAVDHGSTPAVSFLKARQSQDGHPGYSDPLDEQRFLVETVNRLQRSPQWKHTAIIITYDDSDGWYDHVMPPIVHSSRSDYDFLTADKNCGDVASGVQPGRCGYGPRMPFLLISPYARRNFVDHTLIDQTSIARFIEDNWGLPRIGGDAMEQWAGSFGAMFDFNAPARGDRLILDPETGAITHANR